MKNQSNIVHVTDLIEKFKHPFDKDLWSGYRALEHLLPADDWQPIRKNILETKQLPDLTDLVDLEQYETERQNILNQWELDRQEACDNGIKKHKELEDQFNSNTKVEDLETEDLPEYRKAPKDLSKLEDGTYAELYLQLDLGTYILDGKPDLISKKGNTITIWDYKFVKHIDKRGHFNQKIKNITKMKFPLTTVEDINYKHYTLQLSLYAYMLQQINPEWEINKLILIHYTPKGKKQQIYVVDYLKEEVEKLLTYYKKQYKLDCNKAKRQKIIY